VLNDEVWEKVKEGTFQGFSVELFSDLEIINEPKDEIEELIEELLSE
jgi:hypothetical protein